MTAHDKNRRAFDAKAQQVELATIFDAGVKALTDGQAALDIVPNLVGRIESLEQRNTEVKVDATLKQPAKPKGMQKRVDPYRLYAVAIGCEIARRKDHIDPETFVREVLSGDDMRHARNMALRLHKAATSPATTTDAAFGADLVEHIIGDYVTTLAPRSAMAQLVQRGYARRLNFMGAASVTYPIRNTGTLHAAFVQEDGTIPVKAGQFASAMASRHKVGVIAAVSDEVTRVSNPDIVGIVETAMVEDTSVALDGFFLDALPNVPMVRPPGIMSGATTQPSAGNSIEEVITDLKWLLQQLISIRARTPVLLMNPLVAASLSMKTTTGTGVSPFAAELAEGKLAGLPVILSENVDASQVIAMDADNILIGVDAPEFRTSEHASIVMVNDDGVAPTMAETDAVTTAGSVNISDADYAGAEVRGMFQTNSIACRFIQPVSWAQTRAGVVFAVTGVAW